MFGVTEEMLGRGIHHDTRRREWGGRRLTSTRVEGEELHPKTSQPAHDARALSFAERAARASRNMG